MAKPAVRTLAHAQRRSGGSFLLGIFIGLLSAWRSRWRVAFYLNQHAGAFPRQGRPEAAKDAKARAAEAQTAVAGLPQSAAKAAERDKPKFDFYKILPGDEEPVTDRELKEAPGPPPKVSPAKPEAARDVLLHPGGLVPESGRRRQPEGATRDPRLRVERRAGTLPDKGTWYRVRLGPYTSIDETQPGAPRRWRRTASTPASSRSRTSRPRTIRTFPRKIPL